MRFMPLLSHPLPPPSAPLQFFHDMGLIGNLLLTQAVHTALYFLSPLAFIQRPASYLRAASDCRAGQGASPNFGFHLMATRPTDEELRGLDLSHLKSIVCGAEPIAADVVRAFAARFRPYGFDPAVFDPA